ncbi:LOW QUALITY PROTEIN: DNA ligase 1-like [Colossoma macropomum]|uniref:LOW QUALITY PROTEIN: DNA ligase 1-like n=1 Tax=Colossoma macropomum TaxID=42526 RepID=UPI0018644857|nr:LOW QUALITY PROTEIN: DNA ligase 1-like [Colossoma macropomum]
MDSSIKDLKAAVGDALQNTAHVYSQALDKLEKVQEEVSQVREQLETNQIVEIEQNMTVQHYLLVLLEELTAAQGKKHEETGLGAGDDLLANYQDLERENSQLKDRLFRMEMEMKEDRERWKAEKEEVMRRSENHLEEMSINRAMMEQQVRDVESENLQLKERLFRMEMEMKEERERWKRGDEKELKERKKELKKKDKELKKQMKEEEKRVRNLEREREKERKVEEKERKKEQKKKDEELKKQMKELQEERLRKEELLEKTVEKELKETLKERRSE